MLRHTGWITVFFLAGCHLLLPLGGASDGAGSEAPPSIDLSSLDRNGDHLSGEDPGAGEAGNDGLHQILNCKPPVAVNDMKDTKGGELSLVEPALQPDGKTLVARTYESDGLWAATRIADGKFGPWSSYAELPSDAEDPSFFVRLGTDQAIVARSSGGPRVLEHCPIPTTQCQPITVTGLPAGLDYDGPDVQEYKGPQEVMVFAAQATGSPPDLYLATALSATGPYQTSSTPLQFVNTTKFAEDDPALSPDGFLMIYATNNPAFGPNPLDLWVALRLGPDYVPVGLVLQLAFNAAVNSPREDGAPDLADGAHGLELFFHSDRLETGASGPFTIYRAVCNPK